MAAEKKVLAAADYAVFGAMLLVSLLIGVFFAIKDRKNKHGVDGYLMAGRKGRFWPVGASMSLSILSSVTVLGIPTEMYMFGSMFVWLAATTFISLAIIALLYVEFYYPLNLKSNFEYLKLRFNNAIRLIAIFFHIIQLIMYIGVMIYAPSIAMSTVTTFNLWACIVVTGVVCTIYTTLGGLKAVIWTDVFQAIILSVGIYTILFVTAYTDEVGSWENVWRANRESGRFDFFRFDMDPRYRHTFWTVMVGITVFWTSIFATSQFEVQRYLCCRTKNEAIKATVFCVVGIQIVILPLFILGYVMYAYFENCDPLFMKQVSAPDQLLPLLVMNVFENRAGLPGLFIASLFAACLSTVSSGINAMSAVTVQDVIRPFAKNWTENTFMWLSKGFVIFYGALCTGFACVSPLFGSGVLQAALSVLGLVGGPLLGLFTLGIIFPCANSIGAGVGFILGLILPIWMFAGSQVYPVPAYNPQFYLFKPRSISRCVPNATLPQPPMLPRPAIADDFYTVSYTYYASIGLGATLVIGLIISLITYKKGHCENLDPRLVRPIFSHNIFKGLPTKIQRWCWCGVRHDLNSSDRRGYGGSDKRIAMPEIIPPHGKDNPAYD